ncbi:MAG: HD domain-containing protein [Lachnospiraceae bacterium]|nr:HD domain-containing protein [Lachnospiraceae bacterium]
MSDINIAVPEDARKIIRILNDAGHEAYVVGGCVRDSVLGRNPADWDITTSASPAQVKELFCRTVDTGIKHGTVTVLMKSEGVLNGYEVTTYRIDGIYDDGRHPRNVTFTSDLSKDLERRDFTINAMAYHPKEGLVDLFGGKEDLSANIIRCVGDAEKRFGEDALRMMRAIRFAAQLGAQIEPDTYTAIKKLAPALEKVSAERIRVEVEKLLMSDNPEFFRLFYESGLTKVFMPEFDVCMVTTQENPHHAYNVGEHMLHAVSAVNLKRLAEECREDELERNKRILRLTMLLHDIGKPAKKTVDEAGIAHFKGHPELGTEMSEEILRRLRYDNDTIKMVTGLIAAHEMRYPAEKKNVRRIIGKVGEEFFPLLYYVNEADALAQSTYMREEKLQRLQDIRRLYEEIKKDNECLSLKDLAVKGSDLISAGISPGPGLGIILQKMLEDVIEDPSHNDRDYLMSHLEEYNGSVI